MDEETKDVEAQAEETATEADAIDWKAEARKWEAMAKKSKAAENELAELKQTGPEELEAAISHADALEKELAEAKAEAEHERNVREVSASTGAPAELLGYCSTREEMEKMAAAYESTRPKIPSAAQAVPHRIIFDDGPKPQPRQLFAEFVRERARL